MRGYGYRIVRPILPAILAVPVVVLLVFLVLPPLVSIGSNGWAQAIPQPDLDTLEKQQRQLQQQQERKFQDYLEELEEQPKGKGGIEGIPEVPSAPEGTSEGTSDRCFEVHSIVLKGVSVLTASEGEALQRPFLGRCLSLEDINALIRAVTNLYVEKGYATTRAFLPQQDISDASLEVLVVEGRIEGLALKDDRKHAESQLFTAFPGLEDEFLNLRDLEQGLDQMNRLSSSNATMMLSPGKERGDSVVVIENKPTKPWRISAGLDNSGNTTTGKRQRANAP